MKTTAKVLKCTAREMDYDPDSDGGDTYDYEVWQLPNGEIFVPELNENWMATDAYETAHGNARVDNVEDTGRTVEIDERDIEAARTAYL